MPVSLPNLPHAHAWGGVIVSRNETHVTTMSGRGYRWGESGTDAGRGEPDLSVAFVLSPDFTLLPLAGFIDALRLSADEADRSRQIYCRWACLSATDEPIRSSCGLEIVPWGPLEDAERYDYLVVVGGLIPSLERLLPGTLEFIRTAADAGRPVLSLCTGSFILARAGLMKGRRCAVHAHRRKEFIDRYPDSIPVDNEIYVTDGPFTTCLGGTAAIDLAVDILCGHCGKARGMKGLTALVVDEVRNARQMARLPYRDFEECGDWRVERAVRLMRHNLGTPMRIEDLANELGSTVLQLERAFKRHTKKPPLALWRGMRLQHARWRLLNTSRSVAEIAFECGFADSSHFSRWFKKEFGAPPQRYREMRAGEAAQT